MILNPCVFLLLLVDVSWRVGIGGEMLVVLAVPQRPWRSEGHARAELGTRSWVELVVGRGAAQRDAEVEVVGIPFVMR